VLSIGSCCTGLNIIPIRRMVFVELDWSPATLDQCEARINRIGGSDHLHYTYLLCDHTLDPMVFNKLKVKSELITEVVDDSNNYGDFEFDDGDGDIQQSKKKQKI
jgi:SNF2 family DNA or RNA helicase